MNIFAWHVHGSWMTAFVHGRHRYFVPVDAERSRDGLGRSQSVEWPRTVTEVDLEQARGVDVDVVVLQRPHEPALLPEWVRGRPPVIYVEHDTPPRGSDRRHPLADRDDIVVVHVTHFNASVWRMGSTRSVVIEHGVLEPQGAWSGELPAAVAAINEPERRSWETGFDLLRVVSARHPIDLFGIDTERLGGASLPQGQLHREMARRRLYVHPFRWTSLGLTLLEAMRIGMPCVVLGATEALRVIPRDAVWFAFDGEGLAEGVRRVRADDELAQRLGEKGRAVVAERFSVERFQADWDRLLAQVC